MNISSFAFKVILQISIVCVITINGSTSQGRTKMDKFPDYYWRDYIGIIPEDAAEGGTDEFGNPTYVGQAYFEKYELLPVIIFPGNKTAHATAYYGEITTTKNIKILCAEHREKFEWTPTKSNETYLLINRHIVVGGYEIGHTLNIGRAMHDGKVVIGKVFSYPLPNNGLWIPYEGKPINLQSYELLTYNINKRIEPLIINIDPRLSN